MPNAPALQALLVLHQVDSRIGRLESQQKLLPVSLRRIRERLDRQRETFEAKKEERKKLRAESHAKELLLRAAEEEVKELTAKLNTASTNKEYTALQHEITDRRVEASKIEDQVLTTLADIEALGGETQQAEEAIQQIQREHDGESKKVDAAAVELGRQIAQLRAKRQAAAEGVDAELLEEYQRIAARKGASALALVVSHMCQGCFMQLPPQLAHTLVAARQIVHCPSCNRILYLP